jgi:hypothetical protein
MNRTVEKDSPSESVRRLCHGRGGIVIRAGKVERCALSPQGTLTWEED